ncbi:lysozyme inhibitor LprI family protein [Roseicella aquatilis]|uniref:DUF1311 domain-containing protein n=1 Tax=Roseicella aquatilis TaxID=2527868 RepID=A0A4R4D3Y7_9PROT|nr:lysozyme inhibitor LprI family protein [Roseicella aquatilis]TCZ54221.1 DUF1311 domain-containing protein [Roseicella aquatilis]
MSPAPLIFFLASLLTLGIAAPATAQPAVACDQGSNMQMRGCNDAAIRAADAQLNETWRLVLHQVDTAEGLSAADRTAWRNALRDAQRAWIAFRDADCGAPIQYQYNGGTGGPLASLACILDRTRHRTRELTDLYLRP